MSESATRPDQASATAPDAIRVENISKSFGVVKALEDVSLHLRPGEVLGLIGDNGAGKSTLVKILTGFHKPDAGQIFVFGEEVQLKSVTHARSLGIDTVFQDLALVPGMSVYHNIFLNREVTRGFGPIGFLHTRVLK
jgi:simple sugar transport system ATP-binding protein